MDDTTTNPNNVNMSPPNPAAMPPKKSTTGKTLLWVLVGLIVLALGLAGGYFYGQMTKNQELDSAKQAAEASKLEAVAKAKEDAQKTVTTPKKTATKTTCNADELSLSTAPSNESGAGTLAYNIVFTNTGNRTCVLGGFPGVSLVNDNGNQIGSPAERTTNYEEKELTLAPNGKVMAVVFRTEEGNYSPGQCKDGATKLRVYPPNDTGYLSVATETTAWCPGFEISPVMSM